VQQVVDYCSRCCDCFCDGVNSADGWREWMEKAGELEGTGKVKKPQEKKNVLTPAAEREEGSSRME